MRNRYGPWRPLRPPRLPQNALPPRILFIRPDASSNRRGARVVRHPAALAVAGQEAAEFCCARLAPRVASGALGPAGTWIRKI